MKNNSLYLNIISVNDFFKSFFLEPRTKLEISVEQFIKHPEETCEIPDEIAFCERMQNPAKTLLVYYLYQYLCDEIGPTKYKRKLNEIFYYDKSKSKLEKLINSETHKKMLPSMDSVSEYSQKYYDYYYLPTSKGRRGTDNFVNDAQFIERTIDKYDAYDFNTYRIFNLGEAAENNIHICQNCNNESFVIFLSTSKLSLSRKLFNRNNRFLYNTKESKVSIQVTTIPYDKDTHKANVSQASRYEMLLINDDGSSEFSLVPKLIPDDDKLIKNNKINLK